jgi:thiamine-phosphate diphosphorylase
LNPPALLALSPGQLEAASVPAFLGAARAVFERGWRGVVLREARLSDRDYIECARALRAAWPRSAGGWLCVHDRAHLAAALEADALHLGGHSLRPAEVRPWLPRTLLLGLSTHADDDAQTWDSADYLVHAPVQPTTKPGARPALGFEALRAAVERTARPMWALGGLRPEHARQVRDSGAQGMAVLSGVFGAVDAAEAATRYLEAWSAAQSA